jgi:hypothetical protein
MLQTSKKRKVSCILPYGSSVAHLLGVNALAVRRSEGAAAGDDGSSYLLYSGGRDATVKRWQVQAVRSPCPWLECFHREHGPAPSAEGRG